MINRTQTSSAMYGLFLEPEHEGYTLLGLYHLEGEAEAARQAYIANVERGATETKYLEERVKFRRLEVGAAPSWNFAR